jgi:hypothetical protein
MMRNSMYYWRAGREYRARGTRVLGVLVASIGREYRARLSGAIIGRDYRARGARVSGARDASIGREYRARGARVSGASIGRE